jgi:hypothetical protein
MKQGFKILPDGTIAQNPMDSKEDVRGMHAGARSFKYESMLGFLHEKEEKLLSNFADGTDIDIDDFRPEVKVVESQSEENDLFRYASLLWSVPVSPGFGRRVRFLVRDSSNGKLVGIFAIGDPVFNLTCRDSWIGWNAESRKKRLYNLMDVFVLGAVPPYNNLLCGKLVALLAASNETRQTIQNRYEGRETIILKEIKNPRLVLLTTGSALGKSSLYDRIRFNGRVVYEHIGTSKGWGHFHLANGLFEELRSFLALLNPNASKAYAFGQGPNWKIRTARRALIELGLPDNLLKHGITREIYGVPLAANFRNILRGENEKADWHDMPLESLIDFFKERWMKGRAVRCPGYENFSHYEVSRIIHSAGKERKGGRIDSNQ